MLKKNNKNYYTNPIFDKNSLDVSQKQIVVDTRDF